MSNRLQLVGPFVSVLEYATVDLLKHREDRMLCGAVVLDDIPPLNEEILHRGAVH